MLMSPMVATRSRPRKHTRRAPGSPDPRAGAAPEPRLATVFMGSDGTMFHAWCSQPLEYLRTRGGLELDFYCLQCVEHVTLPLHALPRVPQHERPLAGAGRSAGPRG